VVNPPTNSGAIEPSNTAPARTDSGFLNLKWGRNFLARFPPFLGGCDVVPLNARGFSRRLGVFDQPSWAVRTKNRGLARVAVFLVGWVDGKRPHRVAMCGRSGVASKSFLSPVPLTAERQS